MAFVDDLVTLFIAGSAGTAFGTDIFEGAKAVLPSGGGPFITITQTGGFTPERTHNDITLPAWQRPAAQIVARATDSVDAQTRARAAYDAIVGVRNQTVNGKVYREINPIQEPFDIGLDSADRARYAFNITAIKQP